MGDRAGKTISFSGTDGTGPVGPYTGTTNNAGVVNVSVPLAEGVYTLSASFAGDSYYNGCQTTADTIVTVAPAQFKVTGGGWISQGTGRTSFGLNAKSDVTGLRRPGVGHPDVQQGEVPRERRADPVRKREHTTWTGTGKWNGVAGYMFTATVVDNGTSGKKGDTISLVVKTSGGSTVFTTGGAQPLKGGNIVVH